jgi:ribonuclease HI
MHQQQQEQQQGHQQGHQQYTLYFDGCSKGNPGLAGAGAVIYDKAMVEVWCLAQLVGTNSTNNEAEYTGLLIGLRHAVEMGGVSELMVRGDSQLIIRQLKGEYKVKSVSLKPLYLEAVELISRIRVVQFEHVYREFNKRADELSNMGILHN